MISAFPGIGSSALPAQILPLGRGRGGGGRPKGGAGSMHPEHVNGTKVIPLPETNASCVAGELKNR